VTSGARPHGDQRALAPAARQVDEAADQLAAAARLSHHQHRLVVRRHPLDRGHHLAHHVALGDEEIARAGFLAAPHPVLAAA
jgi:hypothetical protein